MRALHRSLAGLSLLTGLAALSAAPVQAGSIEYLFSGTASGSLNGVSFTDAQISFAAVGDTANITSEELFPGFFIVENPVNAPAFTVAGLGSGFLTDPYQVFGNEDARGGVGLTELSPQDADIFDVNTPDLATYDLSTSIGPISGTSVGNNNLPFATSLGNLIITDFGPATFSAITPAAVPEASTTASFGLLLALGMGGVVIAAKRRKRTEKASA